jgi:hypothetical protein
MFDRCTRSILVRQGSIVSSFLADVLCAAGGNLRSRFTPFTIRKASSPAHNRTAARSANRMNGTKAGYSRTDSGMGNEDCKDDEERITSSIYNGSWMWMCAAFAALHVQSGQVQGRCRHWNDVNIRGVYGVTTTFTAKQLQFLHIDRRFRPLDRTVGGTISLVRRRRKKHRVC